MRFLIKQNGTSMEKYEIKLDTQKILELRKYIVDNFKKTVYYDYTYAARGYNEADYMKMRNDSLQFGVKMPEFHSNSDLCYTEIIYPQIVSVIDKVLSYDVFEINKVLNIMPKSKVKDKELIEYYMMLKDMIKLIYVDKVELDIEDDSFFDDSSFYNSDIRYHEHTIRNGLCRILRDKK